MKKIIIIASVLFGLGFMAGVARASDFGFINLNAPLVFGGSYIALDGSGSAAGGGLALITYKGLPSNNILASVISGFVPLTLNGTIGGSLGKASVSAGPGVNLLPVARASAYGLINSLAGSSQLSGLKTALSASPSNTEIFIGPVWGPVFSSLNKCQTKAMIMFAAKLLFN